jgi:transcriptional regulator with XRE-family HTH domain
VSVNLIAGARRGSGLSQQELARRAGTSRPTLSAYEHGHKSPSLATTQRLLAAAGSDLVAITRPTFTDHVLGHGRTAWIGDRLWRLPLDLAFAVRTPALHLSWSGPSRHVDLRDRRQRRRAYEIVLREGQPTDLLEWIDGALLVDLWDELTLPRLLRALWQPTIDASVDDGGRDGAR